MVMYFVYSFLVSNIATTAMWYTRSTAIAMYIGLCLYMEFDFVSKQKYKNKLERKVRVENQFVLLPKSFNPVTKKALESALSVSI